MVELFLSFVFGAVILGVGQWLVKAAADWMARRRRKIGRRLRICIVIDHRRPSRRRRCFWVNLLRSSTHDFRHRVEVKLVSIADELKRGRNPATVLFSPDRTDVIIVNWDAINGDPVYGSDRAFQFIEHYRPDMLEWLRQGGVVVVESQGASWSSIESVYSCFTSMFNGSRIQLCSERWTLGDAADIAPESAPGTLAADISPDDLKLHAGGLWARRPWFPRHLLRSDVQSLRFARRHQHLLYRGWFENWSEDWKAVLVPRPRRQDTGPQERQSADPTAKDRATERRAIALYRRVDRHNELGLPALDSGYVILTTMFIASSELNRLVSNLLTFATEARSDL